MYAGYLFDALIPIVRQEANKRRKRFILIGF